MTRGAALPPKTTSSSRVVFDSSFLIAILERPTTWFEDITLQLGRFQPTILDCVQDELKKLSAGDTKRARFAALALQLAADFAPEPSGEGRVDDEIVSYALANGAAVATLDSDLIKTLKANRVKVISLREGRTALF